MSNDTKRETQKDLIGWFRHAPFRMPRTRPELFRLLAHYNPHMAWDDFVSLIDFTGITPSQIYQVVLGRRPDLASASELPASYDHKRHFREALISREFRAGFVAAFLSAHAEIGRDVFIHIPKCAGTDLILNLGHRSVPVPKLLELEGWTTDEEFLHIAAGLAGPPPMAPGCLPTDIWNWASTPIPAGYGPAIGFLLSCATRST